MMTKGGFKCSLPIVSLPGFLLQPKLHFKAKPKTHIEAESCLHAEPNILLNHRAGDHLSSSHLTPSKALRLLLQSFSFHSNK